MCIKITQKLTVYYEKPFWIGVFELEYDNHIRFSKVYFGSEPKDYEVYEFLLIKYQNLKFSSKLPVDENSFSTKKKNPKRLQREIKKETKSYGLGTKAQQALKVEYEARKIKKKENFKD